MKTLYFQSIALCVCIFLLNVVVSVVHSTSSSMYYKSGDVIFGPFPREQVYQWWKDGYFSEGMFLRMIILYSGCQQCILCCYISETMHVIYIHIIVYTLDIIL
jgi:hypothetical protein